MEPVPNVGVSPNYQGGSRWQAEGPVAGSSGSRLQQRSSRGMPDISGLLGKTAGEGAATAGAVEGAGAAGALAELAPLLLL